MTKVASGRPDGLPADVAVLVRLSAALAARDSAAVTAAMREATAFDPRRVDETIVQSCLFLGFPAALEAAAEWRDRRREPPVDEDPLASPRHGEERLERGEDLCRKIYGSAYEGLRRNVAEANPALDRLMVEVGYGTVLARPGLDPMHRELCIVGILAVQGRERQLHSHLRGALRAGAWTAWVRAALEIGLEHVPESARIGSRRVWGTVSASPPETKEIEDDRDVR